jgi:hypothetical protein
MIFFVVKSSHHKHHSCTPNFLPIAINHLTNHIVHIVRQIVLTKNQLKQKPTHNNLNNKNMHLHQSI